MRATMEGIAASILNSKTNLDFARALVALGVTEAIDVQSYPGLNELLIQSMHWMLPPPRLGPGNPSADSSTYDPDRDGYVWDYPDLE